MECSAWMSLWMECSAWMSLWAAQLVVLLFKTGESMLDATIRHYIEGAVCSSLVFPKTYLCSTDAYLINHLEDIQTSTASYLMYYKILLNFPPLLLNVVFGVWGNRYGWKLPMMLPSLGSVIGIVVYMSSRFSPQYSLELFLIGTAIQGFSGKTTIIMLAGHSYVSETSSVEDRTTRLSILCSMHLLGQSLGSLLAGLVQDATTLDVSLCVVSAFHTLSILTVLLCVRDSITAYDQPGRSSTSAIVTTIKESVMVLLKKRSGYSRDIILILSLASMLIAYLTIGETDLTILYVDGAPLLWPDSWYGYYTALDNACNGFVLLCVVPFLTSRFQVRDTTILILASVSRTLRAVWSALSTRSWMMWTSAAVGCLGGAQWSIASSMLSKEVEENELGKLFSLIMIMVTLVRPVATVICIKIYVATLDVFAEAAYVAQSVVALSFLLISLVIVKIQSKL